MITDKQVKRLERILALADEQNDKLNDFEQGFIADTRHRYDQYEDDIILSERQWDVLERILTKCGG